MVMAETEIKTLNGWVSRVDGRLDKMTESMESLRLAIQKLEMMITTITEGQHQYLTSSSFDHQKVVKDIAEIDERLRDLKRISNERQDIIDKSNIYMKKVDELERAINRVWNTVKWFGVTLATIAIAIIIKWLETIIVRPHLYQQQKQVLLTFLGG